VLAGCAVQPDVRVKHRKQSARHADRLPAHAQGHGVVAVHRIHGLDPYQPGRAGQVTKRADPDQVISAALKGRLRSRDQPITLNKVRQPLLCHTDADVKHPLI
jgi:hypothetical protein